MMNIKTIGVVVGRFQTPHLHSGHRKVLDCADAQNDQLLVVIGVEDALPSNRNPLDFETRACMIRAAYPSAIIAKIFDHPSDSAWSSDLDQIIMSLFPEYEVTLYGSRDSFLSVYSGQFNRHYVDGLGNINATELRYEATLESIDSIQFRKGMIYATSHMFPVSVQTVDLIIEHTLEPKVLLGRKRGRDKWQFIGGFVDPADTSLETAVKREAHEEVGKIEIDGIKYIGSFRVDDFRYRSSQHKIMTTLFVGSYIFGHVQAGDDLQEAQWVSTEDLMDYLIDEHKPLGSAYIAYRQKTQHS